MTAQSSADTAGREIVVTRLLDAPRGLVFRAWTDQEQVDQWWGPNGFTNHTYEMDARPGGVWLYDMIGPDGTTYPNKVVYEEFVPVERLTYVHGSPDDPDQFHVTVTFEPRGSRTLLTMRSLFPTVEALEEVRKFGAEDGAEQTLDGLEGFLASRYMEGGERKTKFTATGGELTVTRTFNAPRALVFEAFSRCEHLAHWWGPKGWTLPVCNIDFRPGGSWQYCMEGPDGMRSCGLMIFEEIVAPERIAYIDHFADEDFNPNPDFPSARSSTEFIEENGKTRLVNRTTYATATELEQVMAMGMEEGLTETWDRLEAYLVEGLGRS